MKRTKKKPLHKSIRKPIAPPRRVEKSRREKLREIAMREESG